MFWILLFCICPIYYSYIEDLLVTDSPHTHTPSQNVFAIFSRFWWSQAKQSWCFKISSSLLNPAVKHILYTSTVCLGNNSSLKRVVLSCSKAILPLILFTLEGLRSPIILKSKNPFVNCFVNTEGKSLTKICSAQAIKEASLDVAWVKNWVLNVKITFSFQADVRMTQHLIIKARSHLISNQQISCLDFLATFASVPTFCYIFIINNSFYLRLCIRQSEKLSPMVDDKSYHEKYWCPFMKIISPLCWLLEHTNGAPECEMKQTEGDWQYVKH